MADEKPHLSLKRLDYESSRYKPRRAMSAPDRDYKDHGHNLKQNISKVRQQFEQQARNFIPAMDPVHVISISQDRRIDEETYRQNGFILLDEDANKNAIVLAKDDLREISRKIEEYNQGIPLGHKSPRFNSFVASLNGTMDNISPASRREAKSRKLLLTSLMSIA